jgi:hypothetical protein
LILNNTKEYVIPQKNIPVLNQTVSYEDYYKAITKDQFKENRIHDLVGKYASHVLEKNIMAFLSKNLPCADNSNHDCNICNSDSNQAIGSSSITICNEKFELNSHTGFSNSEPSVTFEWLATVKDGKKKRTISFGVQIQGTQYRHFIEASGGNEQQRKLILDSLTKILGYSVQQQTTNNWFLNTQIFNTQNLIFEYKTSKNQSAKPFVFGANAFRYSKSDISKTPSHPNASLPLTDLAQAVCRSLCIARKIFLNKNNDDLVEFCTKFDNFSLQDLLINPIL